MRLKTPAKSEPAAALAAATCAWLCADCAVAAAPAPAIANSTPNTSRLIIASLRAAHYTTTVGCRLSGPARGPAWRYAEREGDLLSGHRDDVPRQLAEGHLPRRDVEAIPRIDRGDRDEQRRQRALVVVPRRLGPHLVWDRVRPI